MAEVATHAALASHAGPLPESEAEPPERLPGRSSPGMLVGLVGCGFPPWSRASASAADLLWLCQGSLKFPVIAALDDDSWRSVLHGSGRDRRRRRGELPVQRVAGQIEGSDKTMMLATALLDHRAAPAAGLAARVHERWVMETAHGEVRTYILRSGAALCGKTPDLIHQEMDGRMLARAAVRRLIHEAGRGPHRWFVMHPERVLRRRIIHPGAPQQSIHQPASSMRSARHASSPALALPDHAASG